MTPPLFCLSESILIEYQDANGSSQIITMAESLGLYAFATLLEDESLLSLYPADRPLCSYPITRLTYPEAIDENKRLKTNIIASMITATWAGRTWDLTANMIIQKLQQSGVDWAAVECFQSNGVRAGVRCAEATLVITVYTLPIVNWAFLKMIDEIHATTEFRVEIRVGKVERHDSVESESFTDQTFLPPGSDVSFHYVIGEFTRGTVGGIIELVDGSGTFKKLCALTCRSYLPVHRRPDTYIELESDPTRAPLQQYGTLKCSYPNSHSWFQQLREAMRELQGIGSEIEQIKINWNPNAEPQAMSEQRAYLQSKRNEERRKKQIIYDTSPTVGTICAFSGTRVSQNHHLDWALVGLEGDRGRFNNANVIRESISFNQIKMPPTSTETLRPGSAVYKAKYPDLTGGHISYTKSYVRYKDEGNGEVKVAAECAVIPARNHKQFCMPKDCGAWVVDRVDNTVVGVIYAMNTATGVAYVTPIQEIFDDIKKDTGFSVRLPKGDGC